MCEGTKGFEVCIRNLWKRDRRGGEDEGMNGNLGGWVET